MIEFTTIRKIIGKYKVSKKDLQKYDTALKSGTFEEMETVLDDFLLKYVMNTSSILNRLVRETILYSLENTLYPKEILTLQTGFTTTSYFCQNVVISNFKKVSTMLVNRNLDHHKLFGDRLRKKIRENTLLTFKELTEGRMANTRQEVLFYVRKLQEDTIRRHLNIKNYKGVADDIIQKEIDLFKKDLLKRFPRMEKLINDGRILKSKSWIDVKSGEERFRSYTLDEYADMSIKRTLLNVDIESVEISEVENENHVVEFYLRDKRSVEEPNDKCQYIQKNFKRWGKVLLALDETTAKLLDIWSVQKAKSEGSISIVRHCRHSIRNAGEEINLKVNKVLRLNNYIYS